MSESAGHATGDGRLLGYLVELADDAALIAAARRVRDAGYTKWDAHSPFPVHGLDEAMGIRRSPLPFVTIGAGAAGALGGMAMQFWMNSMDYRYVLSGKPLWSIPAYIPVTFETTILCGALGAFFGMLALNGLPKFYHAVFTSRRFRRVTSDGFFISVESEDPKFDVDATKAFLETLGGVCVERLER